MYIYTYMHAYIQIPAHAYVQPAKVCLCQAMARVDWRPKRGPGKGIRRCSAALEAVRGSMLLVHKPLVVDCFDAGKSVCACSVAGRLLAALAASILTLQPNCFTGGRWFYACSHLIQAWHSAPQPTFVRAACRGLRPFLGDGA